MYVTLSSCYSAPMSVLGQGCKVCPYSDIEMMKTEHISASREDLRVRLLHDRDNRLLKATLQLQVAPIVAASKHSKDLQG